MAKKLDTAVFSLFVEVGIIDEKTNEVWNEAIEIELQPYAGLSNLPRIVRNVVREKLGPNQRTMDLNEASIYVIDEIMYPGASTELQ